MRNDEKVAIKTKIPIEKEAQATGALILARDSNLCIQFNLAYYSIGL